MIYQIKYFENCANCKSINDLEQILTDSFTGHSVSICKINAADPPKHLQFIDVFEDGSIRLSNGNPFDIKAWAAA